jgi:hypothetical protein
MKNPFRPIKLFVADIKYIGISSYVRNIGTSIHNLIKWFPIVWRDRDWDHSFTYDVIRFKLEQQATHLAKHNKFVNTQANVDHARTMVKLIERNRDGHYGMEYINHHETEWEFLEIENKPDYKQLEIHVTSEDFDPYFAKYPRVYKQVLAGKINTGIDFDPADRKDLAFAISHYNEQRCKRILFKMLERNLDKLWD